MEKNSSSSFFRRLRFWFLLVEVRADCGGWLIRSSISFEPRRPVNATACWLLGAAESRSSLLVLFLAFLVRVDSAKKSISSVCPPVGFSFSFEMATTETISVKSLFHSQMASSSMICCSVFKPQCSKLTSMFPSLQSQIVRIRMLRLHILLPICGHLPRIERPFLWRTPCQALCRLRSGGLERFESKVPR